MFSPEQKVKLFLDRLGYFLLLGETDGIVTDYKQAMTDKREIPESNCPSFIDNLFYGTGGSTGDAAAEEMTRFQTMLDALDQRAERYEQKKQTPKKTETLMQKRRRMGINGGTWYPVDTEGVFWIGRNRYTISDQAVQYQPIATESGDYYPMDRILASGGKFYDMNLDEVPVFASGGIISREDASRIFGIF